MKKSLGLFKEVKEDSGDYHTEKFERGYSEMNTKIGIFMMLLLVSGVFAVSVVLADAGDSRDMDTASGGGMGAVASANPSMVSGGDGAENSNISIGEISDDEASVVLKEVEDEGLPELKRTGFINIWNGHGWIDDGGKGHLITSLWAVQKFTTLNSTTENIEKSSALRTFGRLRISDVGMYKLVRYKENTSGNVNFYVIPLKRTVSVDNAKSYAVGKLSLTKENIFIGLTTWKGSLVFSSGNLSREWNVALGTIVKKIQPKRVAVKRARGVRKKALGKARAKNSANLRGRQGAELGQNIRARVRESFWRRIQFWRRD